MAKQNNTFGEMAKNHIVSFRLPPELEDQYTMLRLSPGGFTAWVVEKMQDVAVNRELIDMIRKLEKDDKGQA